MSDTDIAGVHATEGWAAASETIRQWVSGLPVNTTRLVAELNYWASGIAEGLE